MLELGDRLVQEPNVQIDDPQVLRGLAMVRVRGDPPPLLLNGPLVLETRRDVPQNKRPGPMSLRQVWVQLERFFNLEVGLLARGCVLARELTDPESVRSCQLGVRSRETRAEGHGPFEQADRRRVVRPSLMPNANPATQVQIVCFGTRGGSGSEQARLRRGQWHMERRHDASRDAVLDREAIGERRLDPAGPQLIS